MSAIKEWINRYESLTKGQQRYFSLAVIALIAIITIVTAHWIITSVPPPTAEPPTIRKQAVKVMTAKKQVHQITLQATGSIKPSREITLAPQVNGQIVSVHENFIPGGLFSKGEVIVKVDDFEYLLNETQQRSEYIKAEADLKIELGKQRVAKKDWAAIQKATNAKLKKGSSNLILRKPQLSKVQATLDKSKAEWLKAKRNLANTSIKAPFNSILRSKTIDLGSIASSNSSVGTLVATDTYWLELTVPIDQLAYLGQKAPVEFHISHEGQGSYLYQGHIAQIKSDIEAQGLMGQLIVEVPNPLKQKEGYPPLILGSFASAQIKGKELPESFRIPRLALRNGNQVMLSIENRLVVRPVEVLWKSRDWVFIASGLNDGDLLIYSTVPGAIEGMPLIPELNEEVTLQTKEKP